MKQRGINRALYDCRDDKILKKGVLAYLTDQTRPTEPFILLLLMFEIIIQHHIQKSIFFFKCSILSSALPLV
jgi:hypothetical protein